MVEPLPELLSQMFGTLLVIFALGLFQFASGARRLIIELKAHSNSRACAENGCDFQRLPPYGHPVYANAPTDFQFLKSNLSMPGDQTRAPEFRMHHEPRPAV